MSVLASVVMHQEKFSKEPLYSIDQPPIDVDSDYFYDTGYNPSITVTANSPYIERYDDPYVVSLRDDSNEYAYEYDRAVATVLSNKGDSSLSRSLITTSDWKDITTSESKLSSYFFSAYVRTFRNCQIHGNSTWPYFNKPAILSLATKISSNPKHIDEVNLKEVSREFFAILSDYLVPLSFSNSDEYEDTFDGRVIDYFNHDRRISCIVSMKDIQVLSFLGNNLENKIFDRSSNPKLEFVRYIESLIDDRRNDDLESA